MSNRSCSPHCSWQTQHRTWVKASSRSSYMSLRRGFTAKDEDDQDVTIQRVALDEDEQEELIQDLSRQNEKETEYNLVALDCLICLSFLLYLARLFLSFSGGMQPSLRLGHLALLFLVLLHPILISMNSVTLALSMAGWQSRSIHELRDKIPLRLLLIPTFAPMTASYLQGHRPHEILFWGFPFLLLLLVVIQREEDQITQDRLERLRSLKYELKGA